MTRRRHAPEQIIREPREADADLVGGLAVPAPCKRLGLAEGTDSHRRDQCGGMKAHDGTITTEEPDQMWGTDTTTTVTTDEGLVHVFVAVDHCTCECVGLHAARRGDRFEALEPLRQGVREHFGGFDRDIARGLAIRHDHGSAYLSDDFQRKLTFLGMVGSPSFVREPGERPCRAVFRTLKGQMLWVRSFATMAELAESLREFKRTYNERSLVGRHGHRTPGQVRRDLKSGVSVAA